MKKGEVVFENSKGKATFKFYKENEQPIYLIERTDGYELWTNSMEVIESTLKEKKQLRLWN